MAKKTVKIVSMAFDPPSISISRGDCVCWTNEDGMAHTVTFEVDNPGGNPASSGDISPQNSFDAEFQMVGTFEYHCANHPSMKGTVVVS